MFVSIFWLSCTNSKTCFSLYIVETAYYLYFDTVGIMFQAFFFCASGFNTSLCTKIPYCSLKRSAGVPRLQFNVPLLFVQFFSFGSQKSQQHSNQATSPGPFSTQLCQSDTFFGISFQVWIFVILGAVTWAATWVLNLKPAKVR